MKMQNDENNPKNNNSNDNQNTKRIDMKSFLNQLEVLMDPQRTKIYLYIKMKGQATTNELAELLMVNKSTLSYHLTKLVENNLLIAEASQTGRFIKIYKLPAKSIIDINFDQDKVIKTQDSKQIWNYLKSLALEYRFLANRIDYFLDIASKNDFSSINRSNDKLMTFKIENKSGFLPGFKQFDISETDAHFIETELIATITEHIQEKCKSLNDSIEKRKKSKELYYTFTIGMFPILD